MLTVLQQRNRHLEPEVDSEEGRIRLEILAVCCRIKR
jgi:hypothetical protein